LTEFLYDERTPIPALLGTVKRLTYGLFGLWYKQYMAISCA
jgi:hypothetical protein